MTAIQIFPFWKAIEALTPQKIDKDNPNDKQSPVYNIDCGGMLPWHNPRHCRKYIPPGKEWHYSVQFGVYELAPYARLLENKIGRHEEVFDDGISGKSRLFDIRLDKQGIPRYETFTLSLSVWAAGQILRKNGGVLSLEQSAPPDLNGLPAPSSIIPDIDSGFSDFDVLTKRLMQWIADESSRMKEENLCADLAWLDLLARLVHEKTHFPESTRDLRHACLVKCFQLKSPKPSNETALDHHDKPPVVAPDDLLNSFFIQELRQLDDAWQSKSVGDGFAAFMTATADKNPSRLDIRSEQGLEKAFQCLLPKRTPAGCWPSKYPLAFSQQLAVNEMWQSCGHQPGIFAVNGPPGTGKTTLLRDVVAAVVTQRAQLLVTLGDSTLNTKSTVKLGDKRIPYHSVHQDIKGYAIVVASANNGAVENISLELPGKDAVPEQVLGRSDYFSDLATELIGKPAWGLLAARLGNKSNRDDFMNVFWWRKPKDDPDDKTPQPLCFTPERGEGLAYHLNQIQSGKRQPAMTWADAVQNFHAAQQAEALIREKLVSASGLGEQIATFRRRIEETELAQRRITVERDKACKEQDQLTVDISQLESVCHELRQQYEDVERRGKRHDANKPGLMVWIATFGRSHRQWWARYEQLAQEQDVLRQELSNPMRTLLGMKAKQAELLRNIAEMGRDLPLLEGELASLNAQLTAATDQLEKGQARLGDYWPAPNASDDVREKSAPWALPDWRKAREALFLAALDVHRAYIENHPGEILCNMYLVSDWFQGKDLSAEIAAIALESLCLIVPVISTTFASIPRMFKQIGRETIGWLLIDEAGQALPQQAAGAIWRAARTVVVGDPKQLEPVSGIPPTVEGALARHYGIAPHWWPSEVSTQELADQTMKLGTHLPDPAKDKVWVGCPLRVHRRCDKDPMFLISNKIAYDGLMVHGKKETSTPLPQSCWIDVVGKTGEGNWIPEEGEAVKGLLMTLREQHGVQPADVFLISPFRDCANRLERLADQLGFDTQKTGTVHTTQGKEADVVVLVLGGNPQKPGARGWAASRPNLLNVAVSRAKQRLYVIGDRASWQKQRYFTDLAQRLPSSGAGYLDGIARNRPLHGAEHFERIVNGAAMAALTTKGT